MKKEKVIDDEDLVDSFIDSKMNPHQETVGLDDLLALDMNDAEAKARISFESIPANSGVFINLFKFGVGEQAGKKIYLGDITHPENYPDIIAELRRKAIVEEWGDGDYQLVLMKEKTIKPLEEKYITLQLPKNKDVISSMQKGDAFEASIRNMGQLTDVVAKLGGNSKGSVGSPSLDPNTMFTAINSAMQAGVNTAKDMVKQNPPTSQAKEIDVIGMIKTIQDLQPKPDVTTGELLKVILGMVAQMKVGTPPPPPQPQNDPLKMFVMMKEMGLFGQVPPPPIPQENDIDKFIKFMAMMKSLESPQPKVVDPTDKSLDFLTRILPLAKELGGGNGGDTGSIGAELMKHLAPAIPQMIGDIASTIKTTVNAKRDIVMSSNRPPVTATHREVRKPSRKLFSKKSLVIPALKPLADAVEVRDISYFPQLTQLLGSYVGEEGLMNIIKGVTTIPQIQAQLKPYSAGFFNSAEASNYFSAYINYLKIEYQNNFTKTNVSQPNLEKSSSYTGTCTGCQEQFSVHDPSEFNQVETSTCPNCGSKVIQDVEIIDDYIDNKVTTPFDKDEDNL